MYTWNKAIQLSSILVHASCYLLARKKPLNETLLSRNLLLTGTHFFCTDYQTILWRVDGRHSCTCDLNKPKVQRNVWLPYRSKRSILSYSLYYCDLGKVMRILKWTINHDFNCACANFHQEKMISVEDKNSYWVIIKKTIEVFLNYFSNPAYFVYFAQFAKIRRELSKIYSTLNCPTIRTPDVGHICKRDLQIDQSQWPHPLAG